MGKMSCFSGLLGGKRKALKGNNNKAAYAKKGSGNDCPKVKPVEFMDDMADTTAVVDDDVSGRGDTTTVVPASACSSRFVVHAAEPELARHGHATTTGDDDNRDKEEAAASLQRDSSSAATTDLVAGVGSSSGYSSDGGTGNNNAEPDDGDRSNSDGRSSPKLVRSCSNIETTARRSVPVQAAGSESDLPAKSRSYNDLKKTVLPPAGGRSTAARSGGAAVDASSTASFRSSCSADRVMLKKRSSRQVLPSRSRKLWWQMFLWSHRNLPRRHGATTTVPALQPPSHQHQHDGYTSDTLGAVTANAAKNKGVAVEEEEEEDRDPIPSQWVAFSAELASPLDRVSAWVSSLSFQAVDDDATGHGGGNDDGAGHRRPAACSEIVEESSTTAGGGDGGRRHFPQAAKRRRAAEEAAQAAGGIVQTLNTFSSVAHIAGMGLKAVPMIAAFSTLRAVNLSGNMIVQISAGSLPKGLHSLDLSRNKIAIIEGLRELTRLRVLNLSYNRISRIGHGLSSCTAIRELYLAGNKISEVEGLHRLLKLAVLDVSFNKITTPKSLGQLVANYGSLRAINLVGNPVQANTGDDTLRRAVDGLLPRIEYLNRQAVKPVRAREVAKDSVAQAALGNGNAAAWNSRRRLTRRLSQSPGSASGKSKGRGRDGNGNGNGSRKGSRSRSMTKTQKRQLAKEMRQHST